MRPPAARSCDPNPPLPPHRGTERRRGRNVSLLLDSKVDIGADEDEGISLFDVVVRMSRLLIRGRRSDIWVVSSEICVDADTGRERVDGKSSPGKEVRKTLMTLGAIVQ